MMGWVADRRSLQAAFILPVIAMAISSAILFAGMKYAPRYASARPHRGRDHLGWMSITLWIAGIASGAGVALAHRRRGVWHAPRRGYRATGMGSQPSVPGHEPRALVSSYPLGMKKDTFAKR